MGPLRILTFNCGSASLKFALFELDRQNPDLGKRVLAHGSYERLGHPKSMRSLRTERHGSYESVEIHDHLAAANDCIQWLKATFAPLNIDAVAHRIVHGGDKIQAPTIVSQDTIQHLEEASKFAPLHNPPAIAVLKLLQQALPQASEIVIADTAFHSTIPLHARIYAIPFELYEKQGIRRFGFHGIGHAYMLERCAQLMGKPKEALNLITMQLGGGCSITAISQGRSIETSMGLTPLEGLVMGTRPGDMDVGIVVHLATASGMTLEEIDQMLNHRSGLLGISGISDDFREIAQIARDQPKSRAAVAVDSFVYRIRKYLGAYMVVLGKVDAIVFGGGIGEHSAEVRAEVCKGLEAFGILLDQEANRDANGREMLISAPTSRVAIYVIPLDEELYMARLAARLLTSR